MASIMMSSVANSIAMSRRAKREAQNKENRTLSMNTLPCDPLPASSTIQSRDSLSCNFN